jgi:hypothetical protein
MSARKKVNQSRPPLLADAVVPGAAESSARRAERDGTPSLRGPSGPPPSSSAIVDSFISPAPQGSYGSGFSAECAMHRPPLTTSCPRPARAHLRSTNLYSRELNMRKEGDFADSKKVPCDDVIWNFCSKAERRHERRSDRAVAASASGVDLPRVLRSGPGTCYLNGLYPGFLYSLCGLLRMSAL